MNLGTVGGAMFRSIAAALSLLVVGSQLGCAKKASDPIQPCQHPKPTLDQCLDTAWMTQVQEGITQGTCADQLNATCYDLFADAQSEARLKQAACDDYWKPCTEALCPTGPNTSDAPVVCYRVTLELYPTHVRTDGLLQGNQISYACRKTLLPGKPPLTTTTGNPLEQDLQELILQERTLPWSKVEVGGLVTWGAEEQEQQQVMSLSIPAEPASQPAAGKRSLNNVRLSTLCAGETLPEPNITYESSQWFDEPLQDQQLDIAELGSCQGYALNKYYDWSVFKARMSHERAYSQEVPDILRVRKAFGGGVAATRGAIGSLYLSTGLMSQSLEPGAFSVGPNPAFPLTAGVSRQVTLVREILFRARRANLVTAPDDHRHRLKFVTPALASWTSPCPTPTSCLNLSTTEDWAWHRDMLNRYLETAVTPLQEVTARLQRQALLELLARRAQVEVAAWLAGREVTPVARTVILPMPSESTLASVWAWELNQGHIFTTLESVTTEERLFLQEQFARDWELVKFNVKTMSDATLDQLLREIDELIEASVTRQHAACLAASAAGRPVLCDWLPEMFTARFEGVTERDLLALPAPGSGDLPDAGPSADKHRCDVYTAGLSFSRLAGTPQQPGFAFSCPLNSSVGDLDQYQVCGCTGVAGGYLCGDDHTFNPTPIPPPTGASPLFYPATAYRDSIGALQLLFGKGGRVDRMNDVAFAVATSFIPNCSPVPTMTEVRAATQALGFGLFGATLVEEFSWSKSGAADDRSFLKAHFMAGATVLSLDVPLLDVTATADRVRDSDGTRSLTVKAAGMNLPVPGDGTSFNDGDEWLGIAGFYPFMVGPIPMSVSFGVGGSWSVHAGAGLASPLKVTAGGLTGANLFVEGGVDAGIAGAGIGAYIDIVKLGPSFSGTLGMRTTPPGSGDFALNPLQLSSTLDLDTVLLSGAFYAWAKVGVCPICKKFSLTLFEWGGYRLKTPVWSRSVPLTEGNLDKLAAWHPPPQCTN